MATSSINGTDYLALHFGRPGCAIGEKFWELTSHEHDINISKGQGANLFRRFKSLFYQNENGFYRARALFIDPDGQDISSLKQGPIKGITDPDFNFITNNEDTSGNFASGVYTHSTEMIESFEPKIHKMIETCDKTPCFLSTVSYSGGCSGVYCRFLTRLLQDEFSKATHINFCLLPSPNLGKSIIDTYNFVHSQAACYSCPSTLRVVFDNEALYDASSRLDNLVDLGFGHVNKEIANVMSLVTSANRFNASDELVDLSKLIVKKRLNYLIPSYTRLPGVDSEVIEFDKAYPVVRGGEAMLASCPNREVLSDVFYTKGHTPSLFIQQQLDEAKLEGMCENIHIDPRSIPVRLSAFDRFELGKLTNNTGMRDILVREAKRFDIGHHKRAFVFWYVGNGMEEGEFSEARYDLDDAINEYPHEEGDFPDGYEDFDPRGPGGGGDDLDEREVAEVEVLDDEC